MEDQDDRSAGADEFAFELSPDEPVFDPAAANVDNINDPAGGTAEGEELQVHANGPRFLRLEQVAVEDLVWHPLHPQGHEIYPKSRLSGIMEGFATDGQVANLIADDDPRWTGVYRVYIDGGTLYAAQQQGFSGTLRVEVWSRDDVQVAQAVLAAETTHQKLSWYERATLFQAFVDKNGGVQSDCHEALGLGSEAGLSRALAPIKLRSSIMELVQDKTGIGVGVAAKLVTACGVPEKLALIEAWIQANATAAKQMETGAYLKTLLAQAEPRQTVELVWDSNDGWLFRQPAENSPILATVRAKANRTDIMIPNVTALTRTQWIQLRAEILDAIETS